MTEKNDSVPVGMKLKELREGLGLTLRDVQEKTNISGGHLSLIENGKVANPSPTVLQRLAELYGTNPEDLLVLAGYLKPGNSAARKQAIEGVALAQLKDLDEGDIAQVSAFIRFLRQEKKKATGE